MENKALDLPDDEYQSINNKSQITNYEKYFIYEKYFVHLDPMSYLQLFCFKATRLRQQSSLLKVLYSLLR